MSNVALVLGPITFADFEIPSRIDFGGTQRLAVHDLPGGGRIVDLLGPSPADIAWSGIFSGPDAARRAQTLDGLRVAGGALLLSWDDFLFSVVIRAFTAEYATMGWVPYRLTCAVLQDQARPGLLAIDALIGDVLGDVASAAGFADLGGLDLSDLQATLGVQGAGSSGTGADAAAAIALSGSLGSAVAGRDAAGSYLGAYAGSLGAGDITLMVAQARQAALLAAGAVYLSRATANFNGIGI